MIVLSRRGRMLAAVAAVAVLAASCSAPDSSDPPRQDTSVESESGSATTPTIASGEVLLDGLPTVELTGPPSARAGHYPLFSWEPVPAAATYQLVVSDPTGPIWAWEGTETLIRFGGLIEEPPPDYGGPSLDGPACWSVVAVDTNGHVVAASAVVPVTPGDEAFVACTPGT